ncbi:uncharacterized protein [Argopecten irradians]|uniref:uncharacterized protein n=1 Tax=Argopecten irradians TaxID=31199 RepID=UPI0037141DA7
MATAKMAVCLKGQTTCIYHKGEQLGFYCEQCQELACPDCVANNHKGHMLCRLNELTFKKNQEIRSFIEKTERTEVVEVKNNIASSNTMLQENDRTFEKLSKQLKAQTDKLKKDMDRFTDETLSLYQKIKHDNTKLIQKYKQQLEIYDKQLEQQLQECKRVLQQGSHIEIYDTECEIDSRLHLPAKPALGTARFIPNKNPRDLLELAIGKCESVSAGHGLLAEAKVVAEFKSICSISSICPTTDDQAWTKYHNTLTLLDMKDTIIQKVTHNVRINDISLSPTTHALWACDRENHILKLSEGQLNTTFNTKQEPKCICVTADDHIIIGMSKTITKYTTQGRVVLSTMAAVTQTPLVCSPWRITECPVTNNVAVIDHSYINDGGDGHRRVVVMNSNFQELFVYRGDISSTNTQAQQRGSGNPFDPWSIVYDSQGNIIVNDWRSRDVFILSGSGVLLRTLYSESNIIGVDRRDILWSVYRSVYSSATTLMERFLVPSTLKEIETNTNVKLLQYCSESYN